MSNDTVPSKPLALTLLATAQFMIVLDASVVNVALPSIRTDLHFSPENLSWVVNAYVLMFGGFLLLGGRLGDLLGRRRLFIAGMVLFAAASLGGGFAQTELQLILWRGLQGLGAAMVSPAALSTLAVIFREGRERNKAFGVWGAVGGVGAAAGVLLGGILVEFLGWQSILWVNVPVGLAAALLAPRLLIESKAPDAKSHDFLGAITVTAGLVMIVYAIVNSHHAGVGSFQTLGTLCAGLALLALFVAIEHRVAEPLITFSILKLRTLRTANFIAFASTACVVPVFIATAMYLQQVLGFSALESGLAVFPSSALSVAASAVAANAMTRVGFKPTLIFGTTLLTLGIFWLSHTSVGGSWPADVLGPLLVFSSGLGMVFVAMTSAAMTGTDRSNLGLGSGLFNTSQQIGAAVGVAFLITISTGTTDDQLAQGASRAVAINDGLNDGLLVLTLFGVAALLLAIFGISTRDSRALVKAAHVPAPVEA